jgi:hypothetical protein
MKVTNEIEAGLNDTFEKCIKAKIESHWNYHDAFELVIDGKSYWFRRKEFEKAIQNACNK